MKLAEFSGGGSRREKKSNCKSHKIINNKVHFNHAFKEVYSDCFEATNLLYIGRSTHNSSNFINKFMALM